MTPRDALIFTHATRIAEDRIRQARRAQSHAVCEKCARVLRRLMHLVHVGRRSAAGRQTADG